MKFYALLKMSLLLLYCCTLSCSCSKDCKHHRACAAPERQHAQAIDPVIP
ncbi:hypothetical protein B0I18_10937 [Taibaiella chishuiensis]|uniref:Uncharacterized protein n=1 Tax=Taibaiella chishuiensis TaxID=1434707 RepID=A0A2P8CYI1_9BACT|nr:hypothetical protein B0I18_10937 [Taibaiella chishuiensis]